jgi:acetolactate synthase-1/2/3 large subunit/sulfoacetaldehyde acetyltransferase
MKNITGGRLVAKSLVSESVEHVFGLIGSAGMEIFDGLYDESSLNFIGVRDERTGVHIADGYARASGKPGIFIAGQNGPGVTNLVTGLGQANAANSPVIAIAGSLATGHQYRDAFQEVDQHSLLKTVTKRTVNIPTADRVPELMRDAFRTAIAPKQGPVALNIARDVLSQQVSEPTIFPAKGFQFDELPGVSSASLERCLDLIKKSNQPVLYIGGGVKNGRHGEKALRLAELLNCPIVLSPGHGDGVSCEAKLYAGQTGPRGNIVATNLMRDADLIIAVGTRIGFNATFFTHEYLNPHAKIIQVDSDALSIGRFYPVTIGLITDPGVFLSDLYSALLGFKSSQTVDVWTSKFLQGRSKFIEERESYASTSNKIQPAQLFRSIRGIAPKDTAFTLDAGTLCLQATDNLNYYSTPSLFTPLDFGLVGFSYACGLGIKIANPDRTVISLMGDGGFGMACSELGTAATYNISSICIVMNNGCWGAEKAYQRDFFEERYIGADVPNPPYDKLAELWGVRGFRASSIKEFEEALGQALLSKKPCVIDVAIDPDALFSFRRDSFKHRAGK